MVLALCEDGLEARDWLFVEDHCDALCRLLSGSDAGEVYNIAAGTLYTNLDVASRILGMLGKPQSLLQLARYQEHPGWWQPIKSGEFTDYYTRWYGPSTSLVSS